MRTDGVFSLHYVQIKSTVGRTHRLIPFGDIHRDSPAHAGEKWKEFLEWAKQQENALFLGMGDYLDSYSTSERRIIYSHDLHESTAEREQDETKKRIQSLAGELSFMKGRLIGLLGGNHYPVLAGGITGDNYLANLLGTEYLGACSAIKLSFQRSGRNRGSSVDLFAHHGRGAGQTAGGKFNAVERLSTVCEADIFLMGDNHARGAIPLGDKLRIVTHGDGVCLRTRQSWIGRTGSFLKAYQPGRSSYVVDSALQPSSLGWISFMLTPRRSQQGGHDNEWVDIRSEQ